MKGIQKKYWLAVILVVSVLFILFWGILSNLDFSQPNQDIIYGVTFSHKYASEELGLNWTEVYWDILNDLKVERMRLALHWDILEPRDDYFNYTDWDWMLEQAKKHDVEVILAIGRRTPRWPECHDPKWIATLNTNQQQAEILEMLEKTVKHFKQYHHIIAWQVENEPLLDFFGRCPKADFNFLKKEVELVRSLDDRPIMITDTGELSNWRKAAILADIFGTTMYKVVWNKYIGVWRYPWPPAYYYFKAKNIKSDYDLEKVVVAELQAEPWGKGKPIIEMEIFEQKNMFSLADFENSLEYMERAGFREAYLWGVEWWYWLKQHGEESYWNRAKLIWQN